MISVTVVSRSPAVTAKIFSPSELPSRHLMVCSGPGVGTNPLWQIHQCQPCQLELTGRGLTVRGDRRRRRRFRVWSRPGPASGFLVTAPYDIVNDLLIFILCTRYLIRLSGGYSIHIYDILQDIQPVQVPGPKLEAYDCRMANNERFTIEIDTTAENALLNAENTTRCLQRSNLVQLSG